MSLRRLSSFHALVVLMLAVGVGATTAIFSVVEGVLLRPLPFPNPDRLVLVGEYSPQIAAAYGNFHFFNTPSAIRAWEQEATDFQSLAALQGTRFILAGNGAPRALDGARVTTDFFDVLQARPLLGRFFSAEDAGDSTRPMVITEALWRSAFGADPTVIGRTIGASGSQARVIGILPAHLSISGSELGPMTAGRPTEFFVPFAFGPTFGGDLQRVWTNFNFTSIGRLKPGVSLEHARAQLNTIQARLAANAPDPAPGMTLQGEITPVLEYATGNYRQQLWLLLLAVAAVLLVISVNIGGLWVSRVVDRRHDWGIRLALGAPPGRLAKQVLNEGLALGLVGGVLGVICAAAALRGLLALAPQEMTRLDQVHVSVPILAAGVLLSTFAGLLAAMFPALRVARGDPQGSITGRGRSATAGQESVRSRQVLIGLQSALSTSLIAVAGLLGASLYHLMTRDAGFHASEAIEARVLTSTYDNADRERILRQLPSAIEAIPGVGSVGVTSHLPLQGETWIDNAGAPGKEYPPSQQPRVNVRFIGGSYFAAMGIPLIAGRDFMESDRPAGRPPVTDAESEAMHQVVLISEATARSIWPEREPETLIGQSIAIDGGTPTIIGVASDVLDGTLTSAPPAVVYQPYWNWNPASFALVIRTSLPAAAIAGPLRDAIGQLAPDAPVSGIRPLEALRSEATAPQRYQFTLLLTFAGLALGLAAIGVYALVSHSVAQRRKELAIRMALGAQAGDIRGQVARQGLMPVAVGAAVGLAGALAGGRLLESLVYGVGSHDPTALGAAVGVVLLAATLACLVPARRATKVDPIGALRAE